MKRRPRAGRFTRRPSKRMRTRRTIRRGISKKPAAGPGKTVVHHFTRWLSQRSQITGNAAYAPYTTAITVAGISELVNPADFSNLYDQYRLNYIVYKFWLKIDPSSQTASTASYPKLYWYRDYDDGAPPSNLNEIRENQKCKMAVMYPNRPVSVKWKPNVLGALYQSAIATQYSPKFSQWLSMATTNTIHYGVKLAIDDLTNTNYKVDIEAKLYFSCRQPK